MGLSKYKIATSLLYFFWLIFAHSYDLVMSRAAAKMRRSDKIINFAIIPVHTMAACDFILKTVDKAMGAHAQITLDGIVIRACCRQVADLLRDEKCWPMIIKENSPIHKTVTDLHELALSFLERFSSFEENRIELRMYLNLPKGFSASGLQTMSNGMINDRNTILLHQKNYFEEMFDYEWYKVVGDVDKREHCNMLDILTWMREDPFERMFSEKFKGAYMEAALESVPEKPAEGHTGKRLLSSTSGSLTIL